MRINIALFALTLLAMVSCRESSHNGQNASKTLKVGYQNSPIATLLMVAKDKHFFDTVGVSVELYGFTAGKFAVTDLVSGKGIDVALSGELPLVYAAMQGHDARIFSQVVRRTVNECRIVATKDGNVTTPGQYFAKQRTVATSKKGTPEFFLSQYILKYHLDTTRLKIVGMKPEDMASAVTSTQQGKVDAICIFDPVATVATRQLGDRGIVFQDSSMYSALYIVSAMQNTLIARREDITKFLRALNMAADYVRAHPDDAKAIVAKYTKLQQNDIDALWKNYEFDVALTSQLPIYLQQEAVWAKQGGDSSLTHPIPDFKTSVIDTSVLHEVAPMKLRLN